MRLPANSPTAVLSLPAVPVSIAPAPTAVFLVPVSVSPERKAADSHVESGGNILGRENTQGCVRDA